MVTQPTKRRTKSPQKKAKAPTKDFFTAIIESDFHVQCVKEHRFHPVRMWRFDYAIPEHRIALEVEGGVWTQGRHTRPQGFLGDIEKYNTATLMGWRVFRTTPDELITKKTLDLIEKALKNDENKQE